MHNFVKGWETLGGIMLYLVSSTSSYNYNSLYGPCPQGICQLYFGGSGYKVQHLTNGRFKATNITKYIYVYIYMCNCYNSQSIEVPVFCS